MKKKIVLSLLLLFTFVSCSDDEPTIEPTVQPTPEPTQQPTVKPTQDMSIIPSIQYSEEPSIAPSIHNTIQPTVEITPTPTIEPEPEIGFPWPTPTPYIPMPSIDLSGPSVEYFTPDLLSYYCNYSYGDSIFIVLDSYNDMIDLYDYDYEFYKKINYEEYTPNYFEKNYLILFLTEKFVDFESVELVDNTLKINVSERNDIKKKKDLISYYEPAPEYSVVLNTLRLNRSTYDINREYEIYIDDCYFNIGYNNQYSTYVANNKFSEYFSLDENKNLCNTKLYGNEGYGVYLFDYNAFKNEVITIGNEKIYLQENQSIYVLKDGEFCSIYEMYNDNIIDEKIFKSIKDAYFKYQYSNQFVEAFESKFNSTDLYIDSYFGTYEDKMIATLHQDKLATPWVEDIDGIKINFKDSRNMYVYDLNEIYTLKEAYEKNILSKDSIIQIANSYNNLEFEYLHYYYDFLANNDSLDIIEVQLRYIYNFASSQHDRHTVKFTQNIAKIKDIYNDLLYVRCYEEQQNVVGFLDNDSSYISSYYYDLALLTATEICDLNMEDSFIYDGKTIKMDSIYISTSDLQSGYCFFEDEFDFKVLGEDVLHVKDFSYVIFEEDKNNKYRYLINDYVLNGSTSNIQLMYAGYGKIGKGDKNYIVSGARKISELDNYIIRNTYPLAFYKVIFVERKDSKSVKTSSFNLINRTYSEQEIIDLLSIANIKATNISLSKDLEETDEIKVRINLTVYYENVQ